MPFDGNGNWTSPFYPIDDRDNSVPILASKFDTLIQSNLKQSFANCMTIDSQTKPIANIDANNYKVSNVADPTLPKDAVNKQTFDKLTDGSLWIGGGSDVKEEITQAQLGVNLGNDIILPINDTISFSSPNTINWTGTARSDDNTTNLTGVSLTILNTNVTAYTNLYLFVGYDNDIDKNVILEFAGDSAGSTLTNITGAKRFIGVDTGFPTDSSGDLAEFTNTGGTTGEFNITLWEGNTGSGTLQLNDDFSNFNNLYTEGTAFSTPRTMFSMFLTSQFTINEEFIVFFASNSSVDVKFTTAISIEITNIENFGKLQKITGIKVNS